MKQRAINYLYFIVYVTNFVLPKQVVSLRVSFLFIFILTDKNLRNLKLIYICLQTSKYCWISVYVNVKIMYNFSWVFFVYRRRKNNKRGMINVSFGSNYLLCSVHFNNLDKFSAYLTFGGPSCGLLWAVIVSFFRQCE